LISDADADPDSEFYLMRIRILSHADTDPDPTFHPDGDTDTDLNTIQCFSKRVIPAVRTNAAIWQCDVGSLALVLRIGTRR
jgi:hypothetical protein